VQNPGQSLPSLYTALKVGYAHCSASQEGSKAQPNAKAQKGSQASQAKGKPDYEKAGPLADWLKDATAEMKKQGVNQKFTVSSSLCGTALYWYQQSRLAFKLYFHLAMQQQHMTKDDSK
jgi:hypothetical protein